MRTRGVRIQHAPGAVHHQSDAKNDPGDAYKLAELVRFQPRLLHPIQHRSQDAQADLSWIRAREVLVESRTQIINAIRGMSKAFGERLQKCVRITCWDRMGRIAT